VSKIRLYIELGSGWNFNEPPSDVVYKTPHETEDPANNRLGTVKNRLVDWLSSRPCSAENRLEEEPNKRKIFGRIHSKFSERKKRDPAGG